jgi:hypothetical protein
VGNSERGTIPPRIDAGTVSLSTIDLKALLALYGITDSTEVDELVHLARASRQRTWWAGYKRRLAGHASTPLSQAALEYAIDQHSVSSASKKKQSHRQQDKEGDCLPSRCWRRRMAGRGFRVAETTSEGVMSTTDARPHAVGNPETAPSHNQDPPNPPTKRGHITSGSSESTSRMPDQAQPARHFSPGQDSSGVHVIMAGDVAASRLSWRVMRVDVRSQWWRVLRNRVNPPARALSAT